MDVNEELKILLKIQKKKWGEGSGWGGQGGCDRRIEVFGKIHKKKLMGGRVGGSVEGGGSGGRVGGGQGGCERRIEVFVKIQKKMGGGRGRKGGG